MNYPKYIAEANSTFTIYKFTSDGANGRVDKAIKYTLTKNAAVYNLAFGDIISIDERTGEITIDDKAITDNGDRDIVLATVADSAYEFTEKYPDNIVLFAGSNPARTRLYRMAITKNFTELSETFLIFGARRNAQGQIVNVPFVKNENFDGFFIKRK